MTHHYYYPMQAGPQPGEQAGGYMQPGMTYEQAQQYQINMLLDAAKTGAVVGGAGAAAIQLHRYRRDGISWQEAARGTLEGALKVSVETTAATAVGRLFDNSALSLMATLATGTAVMYALNRPREEAVDE